MLSIKARRCPVYATAERACEQEPVEHSITGEGERSKIASAERPPGARSRIDATAGITRALATLVINFTVRETGRGSSSTERWNYVPRGTMDEVRSHVRLDLPSIRRQGLCLSQIKPGCTDDATRPRSAGKECDQLPG
jgi:hypothetical protein